MRWAPSPSGSHLERSEVLVEAVLDEGVGVLRLNDPAHRNVLSKSLSDDLEYQVRHVVEEGAGAIVLGAEPPVFGAGGSLDGLLSGAVPLDEMFGGLLALASAPVPTIAAVGGPAIGAGLSLALSCDVILASTGARFDSRFLDIGMHPGGAHIWRLRQRVGSQGTAAMVLFGDVLSGQDAAKVGLAWRCVDDSDLESAVMDLARRAVRRTPELIARAKQTLRSAEVLDVDAAFREELEAQRWSMAQPGFKESVRRMQQQIEERKRRLEGVSNAGEGTGR
jgi:enoyl-CoA hydratase